MPIEFIFPINREEDSKNREFPATTLLFDGQDSTERRYNKMIELTCGTYKVFRYVLYITTHVLLVHHLTYSRFQEISDNTRIHFILIATLTCDFWVYPFYRLSSGVFNYVQVSTFDSNSSYYYLAQSIDLSHFNTTIWVYLIDTELCYQGW